MLKIVKYSADLVGKLEAQDLRDSLFLLKDMAVFWPPPILGDDANANTPILKRWSSFLRSLIKPQPEDQDVSQTEAMVGTPVPPELFTKVKRYLLQNPPQGLEPDVILSSAEERLDPEKGFVACKLDGKKNEKLNFRSYPLWMRCNFVFAPESKTETEVDAKDKVVRFYGALLRVLLAFHDETEIYLYDENFCNKNKYGGPNKIIKQYLDSFSPVQSTIGRGFRLCFIACVSLSGGKDFSVKNAKTAFEYAQQSNGSSIRIRLETYEHSEERIHNRYMANSRHVLVPDQGASILRGGNATARTVTSPWRFESWRAFQEKMERVCPEAPSCYDGYGTGRKAKNAKFLNRLLSKRPEERYPF